MHNGDNKKFNKIRESYLNWYFRSNPVTATWIGIHTYDAKLPLNRMEDYIQVMNKTKSFLNQLKNVNPEILNKDDQIDYDIMVHSLNESIFYFDKIKSYTWNPMEPVWTLGSGYETLMGYRFAPKEDRAITLNERMGATPDFLENAQAIFDIMPVPYIETAIAQCDGLISVIEDDLPLFIEDLNLKLAENLKQSGEKASKAIKK